MFVIFKRDFCNPDKGFFKGGTGKAVAVPDDIGMLPVDAEVVDGPAAPASRIVDVSKNDVENLLAQDIERASMEQLDKLQADGEARLAANRQRFQNQLAAETLAKKKK